MADKMACMKENVITTHSRQFIREYRRFKQFAVNGGKVNITDRAGHQFCFMRVSHRQHPPRRTEKGLDPMRFADIDLDEPALAAEAWEANR